MNRRSVLIGIIALALVAAGLRGPAPRVLQVWPDRSVGVTSGLLEGLPGYGFSQVLPLGFARASNGDPVEGRTYLHFPLDVFPPGTEILSATLHAYVDSGSSAGDATVGAYRVLAPWEEVGWSQDPVDWPALATSPLTTTLLHLSAVTPTIPLYIPLPLPAPATPSPATATPTAPRVLTATPSQTPSPTPRSTGTSTPTPTPTPTITPTATPTLTAIPTLITTTTPTTSSYLLPAPAPADWAVTMRQRGLSCLLRQPVLQATSTPPNSPLTAPSWDNSPLPTLTPQPSSSPSPSPPPSPSPLPSSSGPAMPFGQAAGTWLTWDVTGLVQELLAGDATDYGLALAPAPLSDPEAAGDLLAARWFTAQDPETMPYLIVEIEVHPVTPTPIPILPSAGGVVRWRVEGLLIIGAALLALSLAVRRKAG